MNTPFSNSSATNNQLNAPSARKRIPAKRTVVEIQIGAQVKRYEPVSYLSRK